MRARIGWSLAALAACFGCYASVVVGGADARFDASTPPDPQPDASPFDASSCEAMAPPGAPATWSGLYADYFGPTGHASCSFVKNACHGAPGEPGAFATGYVCPPTGKDDCYAGLTSPNAKNESGALLVVAGDAGGSYLPHVLRKVGETTGELRMPLLPTTAQMCPSDVDRVRAWIDNGAKND